MSERPSRAVQITVAGESDASQANKAAAEDVGGLIARLGFTLISGGGTGVMEAASKGARDAGGIVVAIIREGKHDDANGHATVVIPTAMGESRNLPNVLAGDALVVIGGGAGTMSEVCFAWIHARPIFTLGETGGWADRLGGAPVDHRATSTMTHCADVAHLKRELHALGTQHGAPEQLNCKPVDGE